MILGKRFLIAAISILTVTYSFAQAQDFTFSEESPINIGSVLSFKSEILSEERKILVSLPDDYLISSKRYPVIYLLDAQYFFQFQYTYGEINALAFMDKIPEAILVGVHSEDRTRDMTSASPTNEGNADKFIEFFSDELQVFIDQQYRTEPYKILIGHSAGGLFALHTLFHAPETFDAYIALSPALQFDNGKSFDDLKEKLEAGAKFNNTLFTSLGNEDGGMFEYYEDFKNLLSEVNPIGLEYSHMSFPDEDHASTIMPGIHHGLLTLYKNWNPPASVSSLDTLLSHYKNLSEHYGYAVDIPARHIANLGFKLIREGDPTAALDVFEYSFTNISQDAIAHYMIGFALRALGRFPEALVAFEQSIELDPGTDMISAVIRFRDEVAQEIKEQENTIEE